VLEPHHDRLEGPALSITPELAPLRSLRGLLPHHLPQLLFFRSYHNPLLFRRIVKVRLQIASSFFLGLLLLDLIGAILVVGWLLVGPLLTIPRISSTGPVVRNGVAAVMVCGEKRDFEGMHKAIKYVPEPNTGTWAPVRKGACTVWYHHPPGWEQRHARQERAQREH
jgi:hypothetical protein